MMDVAGKAPLYKYVYLQIFLCTNKFTHRDFYTEKFLHRGALRHRGNYTEKSLF
jgi:hypothetical protein